jgi:hypothetical protein
MPHTGKLFLAAVKSTRIRLPVCAQLIDFSGMRCCRVCLRVWFSNASPDDGDAGGYDLLNGWRMKRLDLTTIEAGEA